MPTAPDVWWLCPELRTSTFQRLRAGERQTWTRQDFEDPAVSRQGVAIEALDDVWSVTNRSVASRDVFLLDKRYGRRPVPPTTTTRLRRRRSWILLPSTRGVDAPHIVTVRIDVDPDSLASSAPAASRVPEPDRHQTENAGEPKGDALRVGLQTVRKIVAEVDAANLMGAYARPYFSVTTRPIAPASHSQVALCLPGDESRGERLLTRLRAALWGAAAGQPLSILLEVLIREGLITQETVAAVDHAPGCGHRPADLDARAER